MSLLPSLHHSSNPAVQAALSIHQASQIIEETNQQAIEDIQSAGLDQYISQGVSNLGNSVSSGISSVASEAGQVVSSVISGGESLLWDFTKPILSNNWLFLLLGLVLFGGLTYLLISYA